jgi:hypothetical protein
VHTSCAYPPHHATRPPPPPGAHTQITSGAILIPAGTYRITKTLDTRKGVVLRGAGKAATTLFFPFSLSQVYGNTWSEVGRAAHWCWRARACRPARLCGSCRPPQACAHCVLLKRVLPLASSGQRRAWHPWRHACTHVRAPRVCARRAQAGTGSNVSDYSHGTGFINWWGWDPVAPDRTFLTNVTAAARRGATLINVRHGRGRAPAQPPAARDFDRPLRTRCAADAQAAQLPALGRRPATPTRTHAHTPTRARAPHTCPHARAPRATGATHTTGDQHGPAGGGHVGACQHG